MYLTKLTDVISVALVWFCQVPVMPNLFRGLILLEMPKQVTNDRIVQNTNNEQIFTSLSLTDFTRDPSLSSG